MLLVVPSMSVTIALIMGILTFKPQQALQGRSVANKHSSDE